MSIPFDSALSGSKPEDAEREPKVERTFQLTESFCDEIAPQATRFAMSIVRIWADAEEVVQEAFCKLLQSKSPMQIGSTNSNGESTNSSAQQQVNKALLFATVKNLSIDCLRKKQRRRFEPIPPDQLESWSSENVDGNLARLEAGIQEVLSSLPDHWCDALQLKVNGGLSYDEIALVLKVTHAQVRTWIYRARKALEKGLAEKGLWNE